MTPARTHHVTRDAGYSVDIGCEVLPVRLSDSVKIGSAFVVTYDCVYVHPKTDMAELLRSRGWTFA